MVVRPSGVGEDWPGGTLGEGAVGLAVRKAEAVPAPGEVVVAADTVVALDGARLEKPVDAADAHRMLRFLAGRQHEVVTGFCVRRDAREETGSVSTLVTFRDLSDPEIERYVATGEPMDKAGAYGIQGHGGSLVAHVDGSYTNVVGLPLAEVLSAIEAVS